MCILDMPLIDRFMKGIFRSDPPKPKYCAVWDVDKVLETILSWGKTKDLTLKKLTLKLVMIMALTSPKRVSEISQFSLASSQSGSDSKIFYLDMTKNRKQGQKVHSAKFYRFEDTELCPITLIDEYLSRTAYESRSDHLLLSYTRLLCNNRNVIVN